MKKLINFWNATQYLSKYPYVLKYTPEHASGTLLNAEYTVNETGIELSYHGSHILVRMKTLDTFF